MQPPPTTTKRSVRRTVGTVAATSAAALVLAGCNLFGNGGSGIDEGGGDNGESAEQGGHITVHATNFAHIDPQSITFGMWLVQKGLLEGLVLQTPDGTDVRPAVAEDWEVSEDGLTHTFHLRDANWSNGDPITAEDFVRTYERLLDPDRGPGGVTTEASSYQATLGILNATGYSSGAVEDFEEVGIEALDESTLEFTLEAPNPGFVMGLTHPSMLPLHPEAIDGDENWQQPENWRGNGPYNLVDWVSNSSMRLERNPEYWDNENVALDSIDVQLIEQGSITTTVPYESGEVDIQGLGEPADIARFMNDPELSEHVNLLENSGTTYLARLHSRNTLLEDPQIRSALSLGIGRDEIAGISETTEPASTLVSPIVPDWSEDIAAHDPMWGDEAVEEAQRLLADAGYPDGEGFPTLHLLAGSDFAQLDAIIDTWQTNLGIDVVKDVVEVGVYVERRAELHDEDYLGFWYGSFSGVSTWPYQVQQLWDPNFTRQFALTDEGYEQFYEINEDPDLSATERNEQTENTLATMSDPSAQAYAERVEDAGATVDEAEQQEILKEAAGLREEAEIFIPVVWNSSVVIAQPHVQGLELRAQADSYYFKDLSVDEDAE
ncbi:peptide ABC transporter substrate-binding protein [Pseudactinotalea sp. Z1748]|uniref:peptide ABC transporter substrate-binding protein n=1 Tax=Pseudactinotalea sp. Z1748 TaxID=3413027 RepID=UPI003C7CB6B6